MKGDHIQASVPAPVASLPPRQPIPSVHFSMARSVHLSMAIDMATEPLFPRFVRFPVEAGGRNLLELLGEEVIDEVAAKSVIRRAKGFGDAIRCAAGGTGSPAAGGWFRGGGP